MTFIEAANHFYKEYLDKSLTDVRLEDNIEELINDSLPHLDPRSFPDESDPHNAYLVTRYGKGGRQDTVEHLAYIFNCNLHYVAPMFCCHTTEMIEQMNRVYEAKNHDYGGKWEKEIHDSGIFPLYIRLDEKLGRVQALLKSEAQVHDEGIKDTLLDICNYCIITYMCLPE